MNQPVPLSPSATSRRRMLGQRLGRLARPLSPWSWLLGLAALALLSAVLLVVPQTRLFATFVVASSSMEPAIDEGALVVVRPLDPAQIQVGDIVTYTSPQPPFPTVTHRVVGVTFAAEGPTFTTQGDANLTADPWEVRFAGQAGKVVLAIPLAGYAVANGTSPLVEGCLAAIVVILLSTLLLRLIWCPGAEERVGAMARLAAVADRTRTLLSPVFLAQMESRAARLLRNVAGGLRVRKAAAKQHGRLVCAACSFASLWASVLAGPSGYTLAAFSSNTTNNANTFVTANSFGTAPIISNVSPADTSTGIAQATKVSVTFNEAMNTATTQNAFSLKQTIAGASCATAPCTVAGAFTWNSGSTQLFFTPSANLDSNVIFQVNVSTAATDNSAGLHLSTSST
ncbi:MAG: signal peptidase I, partial [Chloroflexota bacterium]